MSNLVFNEHGNPGRKTKRWIITNTSGTYLGFVQFHAPWRKYVWGMLDGSIFDVECTKEVIAFLEAHKDDRQ